MADIGLFYVGAVLIVNGVMLLGRMTDRAAAPLNLFVGTLQVITPTYLVFTANGDQTVITTAAGLYLFGFTYLWVGINALAGLPGTGLGWFSLFVAVAAIGFAVHTGAGGGYAFTVIWLAWSALWLLFFLVLAMGRTRLTFLTGWVAIIEGVVTAAIPAGLTLFGLWRDSLPLAVGIGGVVLVGAVVAGRRSLRVPAATG